MKNIFSKFKSSIKNTKTELTLEYLIILQKSGLPIYSKCWGNFCTVLTVDDTLLSGFLSAITSMPKMMNQGVELNAVEMGFSKLIFNYTTPTGHIICGGFRREELNNKNLPEINNFFSQIGTFLEDDYQDTAWHILPDNQKKDFENYLLEEIVYPWFHTVSSETHSDEMCPFCSNGSTFQGQDSIGSKIPFSERISNLYRNFKEKMFNDPAYKDRKENAERIRSNVNTRAGLELETWN